MDNYPTREQSLDDWPKKYLFPDYKKFAKSGFCYERNVLQPDSDILHCAFCLLSLGGWHANDDPYLEHAKHSPTCIHLLAVRGKQWIRGHVPPRNVLGDDGGLQPLIQDHYTEFRNQSFVITQPVGGVYTTPSGYRFSPPVSQNYTRYDERYRSICSFLRRNRQLREIPGNLAVNLAKAGFYVPAGESHLQCYYCTLKVRQFNADDDPFIIHAQLRRWCFHLISEKGEPFVNYHFRDRSLGRNETSVQEENINTNEQTGYCIKCKRCRSLFEFVCCVHCRGMVCCTVDCLQSRCCDWPRP